MINTLETIDKNLEQWSHLAPGHLRPFWDHMMPDFGDNHYWARGRMPADYYRPVVFVSGPGRNGNHLAHSMMDGHPELPRLPGEDSFLAAFFHDLVVDPKAALARFQSPEAISYILNLSGYGCNKWKLMAESYAGKTIQKTSVWAGTHDTILFSNDYQDTAVHVNYGAYESRLQELLPEIQKSPRFIDAFWLYLDALSRLDPVQKKRQYSYIYVGSGMRAELKFLFDRTEQIRCIAPIRPFETFYFSFAKGRKRSDEIRTDLLQEAWEHWWHKTVDYLLLKKEFPKFICLVNFNHLLEEPERACREICRFLEIDFDLSCTTPTVMGVPTKGNSSFPKDEQKRGTFYKDSLVKRLPESYWPQLYPALWEMVLNLGI